MLKEHNKGSSSRSITARLYLLHKTCWVDFRLDSTTVHVVPARIMQRLEKCVHFNKEMPVLFYLPKFYTFYH